MFDLRAATHDDIARAAACAEEAYRPYISRMGKRPAPMDADFAAHHRNGELEIIEWKDASEGSGKAAWAGYAVTILTPNTLFIDNIALLDAFRGRGIARMLFEALTVRARSHGCVALELYTNAKMTENLALYPRLGFRETDRRVENGFDRVFFQKDVGEGSDDGQ